jgi:hypothetical protein
MHLARLLLALFFAAACLPGCGPSDVIPTTELTEDQKAAIKAEDAKVADEESHGAKKR